ncbi:MAG: transcription elongation factor GreA [Lachnospiraceae bacterium]|nr:transcription elongation factor GreA [Lachnospiraceae bacterium]
MKSEQLTKEDVRRIEEEIEYRKMVVRPQSLKALKEARAMGDLSENFEYYAAKRDNNQNNSRIRYLEKMLRFAEIIEDSSSDDVVGINNTVDVYFEDDDETETYRIVTSIRSDSRKGLISNLSPLGKALLGKKVGERVEVTMENGAAFFVVIKELRNTGEAPTDRIQQY